MASSSLPYAAYQGGHKRGQSSSNGRTGVEEGSVKGGVSNVGNNDDAAKRSLLHRPTISISQVQSPQRAPSMEPSGVKALKTTTSNGGPPPLRTISSLRSAVTSSSPSGSTTKKKAVENGGHGSSSRRTVSSTLVVPTTLPSKDVTSSPSTSTIPLEPSSPRLNGHHKRHSYSPLPASLQPSSHSRSVSSSVLSSSIPHHISTAQRLRAVDSTSTNASSNASSPIGTPRNQSPSMEAMIGSSQSTPSMTKLAGDTIGRSTAYRPGFQPRGTYRVRTDEFNAARERKGKGRAGNSASQTADETKVRTELESQRLERRLEKLIALHYDSTPVSIDALPSWLPNAIRSTRQMAEEEKRIREEELRIVKWEEDSSRKVCPLCSTPFSLSVRKHHCRLCGRIVCASPHLSLPPEFGANGDVPPRKVDSSNVEEIKCSSLVIADSKGGAIIKDMPRWDDANGMLEGSKRGIRMCRECRETIMHRQYMLDDGSVPPYIALYESLITLQKEIEQSLPEFQEMVLGLQKQDAAAALGTIDTTPEDILSPSRSESSPSSLAAMKAKNKNNLALQRDAAQARKQLLANFANYDSTAKRIRNLDDQGNTSLARVKLAIWAKANLFLQQNMFPLQSLPKMSSGKEKKKSSSGANTPTSSGNLSDAAEPVRPFKSLLEGKDAKADARAAQLVQSDPQAAKESLVVLEQQLKLVLEYAASAAKARKFQDAKSLKASAQDLEVEIDRLRRLGIS